jgi:predicted NUDIX family NTP pyrophosphohydrolase
MPKTSAGVLMYRLQAGQPQVLLVHPGGPFWRNKDDGAWSIPKGEVAEGEDLLAAARREFAEELRHTPSGTFVPLTPIRQKSGKTVHAWAVAGDLDTAAVKSNTFTMEWPPGSKKQAEFSEVDRAEFFDLESAKKKINPAQVALVVELEKLLRSAA